MRELDAEFHSVRSYRSATSLRVVGPPLNLCELANRYQMRHKGLHLRACLPAHMWLSANIMLVPAAFRSNLQESFLISLNSCLH